MVVQVIIQCCEKGGREVFALREDLVCAKREEVEDRKAEVMRDAVEEEKRAGEGGPEGKRGERGVLGKRVGGKPLESGGGLQRCGSCDGIEAPG